MKITREQLRLWEACYHDAKIASLVPESGLTPLEVAALDIPVNDRLWVLLREDIIPARALRLLACDWAESACRAAGWDNEHSLNAIAVARRFAVGDADRADLTEAWNEAHTACVEAPTAYWKAARTAWCATTVDAASAADAAGASAVRAAWSVAAGAAVRGEQLADVVKVLKQ